MQLLRCLRVFGLFDAGGRNVAFASRRARGATPLTAVLLTVNKAIAFVLRVRPSGASHVVAIVINHCRRHRNPWMEGIIIVFGFFRPVWNVATRAHDSFVAFRSCFFAPLFAQRLFCFFFRALFSGLFLLHACVIPEHFLRLLLLEEGQY